MMTLTVVWQMCNEERKKTLIEVGEKPEKWHRFKVDVADLTPEQRKPIVDLAFPQEHYTLNLSEIERFDPEASRSRCFIVTDNTCYNQEPTLDDVIENVRDRLVARRRGEELEASIEEAERREKARLTSIFDSLHKEIDLLVDNDDLEGLRNFRKTHPQAKDVAGFESEIGYLNEVLAEAYRDVKNNVFEKGLLEWVPLYGSDELQKAFSEGYHVERHYVVERACAEFPGWAIDFYHNASENVRTNPSYDAIRMVKKLQEEDGIDAEIVWLIAPPDIRHDEDYDDYTPPRWFGEREAIKIENFLGKYDLYLWKG